MDPMVTDSAPLALKTSSDQLSAFFPLLQQGVTVAARVGCSLRDFLCDQLGIPDDYVTGRITTIFLDNRPVDDLAATVLDGARITLSAAMPGLVGAVMRRSGYYAALRQGISHAEKGGALQSASGTVRLKLFNLLLPELGPLVLARGVLLKRNEVKGVLGQLSALYMASYPCQRDDWEQAILTVTFTGPGDPFDRGAKEI